MWLTPERLKKCEEEPQRGTRLYVMYSHLTCFRLQRAIDLKYINGKNP